MRSTRSSRWRSTRRGRAPRRTAPRRGARSRATARAAPVAARRRPCCFLSRSRAKPFERPVRVLGEQLVVSLGERLDRTGVLGAADVPERDERVPLQVARVAARDVEALVAVEQLAAVGLEPGDQVDRRLALGGDVRAALLDPAVPGTDVLADVTAVDRVADRLAVLLGDRPGPLRRPRDAPVRVELSRLVERPRRARVDAEPAG